MSQHSKLHRITIYILTFLFTLHLTPAIYINSSFLGQFIKESQVGYIYTISSLVTILSFFCVRKVINSLGNYRTLFYIILLEFISLLVLAFVQTPWILIIAFITSFVMTALALFNIDIFLENLSVDKDTGGIRGLYLTSLNTAFIVGPFLAGIALTNTDYWKVYLLGAILLIPVLYVLVRFLSDFEDPHYKNPELLKTAKKIFNNKNLHYIFASGFILRFFFSWMVIYTPIYLHDHIGFSMSETATIIGIALIPFILLEALLGKLADKWIGEKEILTAGFIIMAGATALIAFIDKPNFILWSAVLFTTRIGASMVEVMSETYLFKKVDSTNLNIIGFFRIVRPVAYTLSPVIASLLLLVVDFRFLFLILGAITLYGLRYSLFLKDTK